MAMLSWINLADTAQEITATREVDGLGVRNLLTESPSEVWRTPGFAGGDTIVRLSFPAPITAGVIALIAPRDGYLPPGSTVRWTASNTAPDGTDRLNISSAPMNLAANRGAVWHWPAAPITARYWRIRFVAAPGDEYLQFGRLWLGPDFRPTIGADHRGFTRGWADAGSAERAAISGVVSASRGATAREPRFSLGLLTDAEADSLEDAAAAVGSTGQVLVNPRPDRGAAALVLGRFASPPAPTAVSPIDYACDISLREDL